MSILGVATVAFAWVKIFQTLCGKWSDWQAIAARFPVTNIRTFGETYKRQDGIIGNSSYRQGFNIQLTPEGVCVNPSFARKIPILIPWSSIRSVTVGKLVIVLIVEYEREMQFYLPADALTVIKEHVPAARLKEPVSIFETVKAAIKRGERPHWVWGQKK